MKLTKIFYGNQYVTSFHCGKTKWQVFKWKMKTLFKRALVLSFVLGLIYGAFQVGRTTTNPVTAFVDREVKVEVQAERVHPVMERIKICESQGKHFNKNGQVLVSPNTNGTTDTGIFQINNVWDKEATRLGLDKMKEADNIKLAYYIYDNFGTEPWYSSKACWSK